MVAGAVPLEGFFQGDLVMLKLKVKDAARLGGTPLNLAATAGDSARSTRLNEGGLTLIPAPTNAADDDIDGLLTIIEGLEAAIQHRSQIFGPQPFAAHDQALLQMLDSNLE